MDLIHEEEVEHDIVFFVVESILDADYLENIGSLLAYLDDVLVDSGELALTAFVFCTDQIAYFKTHQVNLLQDLVVDTQLILRKVGLMLLKVKLAGSPWDSLQRLYELT